MHTPYYYTRIKYGTMTSYNHCLTIIVLAYAGVCNVLCISCICMQCNAMHACVCVCEFVRACVRA